MDTYFAVKIESAHGLQHFHVGATTQVEAEKALAEKQAPLPDAKFTWRKITDQPEPGLVNGDVVRAPEGWL
jgi:hypothetical protein